MARRTCRICDNSGGSDYCENLTDLPSPQSPVVALAPTAKRHAGVGLARGWAHLLTPMSQGAMMDKPNPREDEALLTPSEVAAMFRVNPKTVTRWARAGKISAIRTLGGHRRFRASEIRKFLEQVDEAHDEA